MPGPYYEISTDSFTTSDLTVKDFELKERMNAPYELKLTVVVLKSLGVDADALVGEAATFTIYQYRNSGNIPLPIYGVVATAENDGTYEGSYERILITVRPRIWQLSLSERSRTWSDQAVPDVVKDVLTTSHGFLDTEFSATYSLLHDTGVAAPKRTTIAQYRESDLDFLHRWLEHEGVYYYMSYDQTHRDVVVFHTAPDGYGQVEAGTPGMSGPTTLVFDLEEQGSDASAPAFGEKEVVLQLKRTISMVPQTVMIHDYEPRAADRGTSTREADVYANGVGVRQDENNFFYGLSASGHSDPIGDGGTYGDMLAAIRAESILCRRKVYSGRSNARTFRTGHVFQINATDLGLSEAELLLTEITHVGEQAFSGGMIGEAEYYNTFTAIPGSSTDTVFRPERTTHWPNISGFVRGTVGADPDAATSHANLDSSGQYTIISGFAEEGSNSRSYQTVRRSQPMSGAPQDNQDVGFHFPLYTGSEVLMAYQDGDPDRPIILGAIPNSQSTDVVGADNELNIIRTRSKSQIVFDDRSSSAGILITSSDDGTTLRLGKTLGSAASDAAALKDRIGALTQDADSVYSEAETGAPTEGDASIYAGAAASIYMAAKSDIAMSADRHFAIHVDGDFDRFIKGKLKEEIKDDITQDFKKNQTITITNDYSRSVGGSNSVSQGDYWSHTMSHSGSTFVGTKVDFAFSATSNMTGGLAFGLFIGGKIDITIAAVLSVKMALEADIVLATGVEAKVDKKLDLIAAYKKLRGTDTATVAAMTIDCLSYTLTAAGAVSITGTGSISVTSAASLSLTAGGSLNLKAGGAFSLQSAGPMAVSAAAGISVKGAAEMLAVN